MKEKGVGGLKSFKGKLSCHSCSEKIKCSNLGRAFLVAHWSASARFDPCRFWDLESSQESYCVGEPSKTQRSGGQKQKYFSWEKGNQLASIQQDHDMFHFQKRTLQIPDIPRHFLVQSKILVGLLGVLNLTGESKCRWDLNILKHILQCGIYTYLIFYYPHGIGRSIHHLLTLTPRPGFHQKWLNFQVQSCDSRFFWELRWAHFNGISQNVAWFSWFFCRSPKNLISKMMDPPLFQRFFCCCCPGFGVWPCRGAIGKYLEGGRKRRHGSTKNPTRMGSLGQPNLKETAALCCLVGENHRKKQAPSRSEVLSICSPHENCWKLAACHTCATLCSSVVNQQHKLRKPMLIGGKTIDMEERFGSVALDIIGKSGGPGCSAGMVLDIPIDMETRCQYALMLCLDSFRDFEIFEPSHESHVLLRDISYSNPEIPRALSAYMYHTLYIDSNILYT